MNLNELRRRRNAAVRARNKSYVAPKAYKNRLTAKAAHGQNKATHARRRLQKLNNNTNKFMNLRKKAQKLGISLHVTTFYGGIRNKTIKELEYNISRR
jgi:hypothetical protein